MRHIWIANYHRFSGTRDRPNRSRNLSVAVLSVIGLAVMSFWTFGQASISPAIGPCPMGTLARYLSHRTAAAPCRTRHRGPIGGAYTTAPHWRQAQVIWPPQHEQGWRPTSARFGPRRCPDGHHSGRRTIHRPSVQRTSSPTAGMKTIIRQIYLACVERFPSAKGNENATIAAWGTARLPRPCSSSARCGMNCTR